MFEIIIFLLVTLIFPIFLFLFISACEIDISHDEIKITIDRWQLGLVSLLTFYVIMFQFNVITFTLTS